MEDGLPRTGDEVLDVIERYTNLVYRLALVYLRSVQDAEDATQEVFLRLFQSNVAFQSDAHRKAWLITVTGNYCKNQLKSFQHRKSVSLEDAFLPVHEDEKHEIILEVLKLPLKFRNVLYLYYYEGYTTAEVASLLHEKESTVRSHLMRGRKLLKHVLEE